MSPCPRCQGFLVETWDVESRSKYLLCLMCSHRPHFVTYRADGLPIGSPLLCKTCHLHPRATKTSRFKNGWDEIEKCELCAEKDRQRQLRYNKRRKVKA